MQVLPWRTFTWTAGQMQARITSWVLVVALTTLLPAALAAQHEVGAADPARESALVRMHATLPSTPTLDLHGYRLSTGVESSLAGDDLRVAVLLADRRRPWWLIPAVGASVGTIGAGYVIYDVCVRGKDDCLIPPALPLAMGAVAGAMAGGVVELIVRLVEDSIEYHRSPERKRK